MSKYRKRVEAVGGIFQLPDGTVLMQKRSDGLTLFPGGKIEEDESSYLALVRECYEEIGITILDARQILSRYVDEQGCRIYLYYVTDWKGDFVNKEPHKCIDLRYLTLEELRLEYTDDLEFYSECIQEYLDGKL